MAMRPINSKASETLQLPTSRLGLALARGWGSDYDLTNGRWLDKYCPGKNRCSDIDSEPGHHVLHNRWITPHREVVIEYKSVVGAVRDGQAWMLRDRAGLVGREKDGMTIERRVFVIAHKDMDLIEAHEMHSDGTYKRVGVASADELGILICKWIWPNG